jgi:hypothetical protein
VPGYEASAWWGVGVPKKTAEIVDKLNKGINAVLADPRIKAQLADMGAGALAVILPRCGQRFSSDLSAARWYWGATARSKLDFIAVFIIQLMIAAP